MLKTAFIFGLAALALVHYFERDLRDLVAQQRQNFGHLSEIRDSTLALQDVLDRR